MFIVALFFIMQSCEYAKTLSSADTRTKTIQLNDITFYDKNCKIINQKAIDLHQRTHLVGIMFRAQKNKKKIEMVIHEKSGNDIAQ